MRQLQHHYPPHPPKKNIKTVNTKILQYLQLTHQTSVHTRFQQENNPSTAKKLRISFAHSIKQRTFALAFQKEAHALLETICGNSSVGRAQPCQGWGREFESRFPLNFSLPRWRNGRRARFRCECFTTCRFESCSGHEPQEKKINKINWRGGGIGRRATLRGQCQL